MIPKKLQEQSDSRTAEITFKKLDSPQLLVEFTPNNYLGFSMYSEIFDRTHNYLEKEFIFQNGSKGSWLLSGNHQLQKHFAEITSAIQCCVVSNSNKVKKIVLFINHIAVDPKAIFFLKVPKGQKRTPFSAFAYSTKEEIFNVLSLLAPLFK